MYVIAKICVLSICNSATKTLILTNPGFCNFETRSAGNVDLINSLLDHVLGELGKIAVHRKIEIVPSLPKPVPANSCAAS